MSDPDIMRSVLALESMLEPLSRASFSDKLYKVSVYVQSVAKSCEAYRTTKAVRVEKGEDGPHGPAQAVPVEAGKLASTLNSSLRFARMNLDAAMVQALQSLAWRPKGPSKREEEKKAEALKRAFDRSNKPGKAMLQHYQSTSDPLDRYLVAGPWGLEYLRERGADLDAYYQELSQMLAWGDSAEGRMALSYGQLGRTIDTLEECALKKLVKP